MPCYEYQCECGVRFEKTTKADKRNDPQPCPACESPAKRVLSADVSHSFNVEVTGPGPQNTGASAVDHDVHRTVGKDAAQKWETIDERKTHKKQVAAEAGRDLGDLSRTADGDYRVLAPGEREKLEGAVRHVAHINKLVQDHRKKKRELKT